MRCAVCAASAERDPAAQKKLENAFAWHHYGHSRKKIAEGLATTEELDALPPQCWRMVWRNPVNHRGALYQRLEVAFLATDRIPGFTEKAVRGAVEQGTIDNRINGVRGRWQRRGRQMEHTFE